MNKIGKRLIQTSYKPIEDQYLTHSKQRLWASFLINKLTLTGSESAVPSIKTIYLAYYKIVIPNISDKGDTWVNEEKHSFKVYKIIREES